MDNNRASQDELDALHKDLALTLSKMVGLCRKSAEAGVELKGAAATLNVARQFLKDNHIEGVATPQSPLGNLIGELPFDYSMDTAH
jgi:hypothetical protein